MYVISDLTYAADTWTLRKKDKDKLKAFQMTNSVPTMSTEN